MQNALFLAADDGNAFVGFLMILGIIWFVCWLFQSKPKSYDIHAETRGTIKPRR